MEAKWNRSYGHGQGRDDLKEGHKSDDDERWSHRRHDNHHAAKKGMDEDEALDEADEEVLDAKVELEWKHAADQVPTESVVSSDPRAQAIIDGFNINWMNMRDATTGRQMWESEAWGREIFQTEKTARLPKAILRCRSISREINFSSTELMSNFRLEQRVYFRGACIEEWLFQFGFVIPGSTNSWQQVIEAAEPEKMLPADILSGNLVIETGFYDGSLFLGKTVVRVLYV